MSDEVVAPDVSVNEQNTLRTGPMRPGCWFLSQRGGRKVRFDIYEVGADGELHTASLVEKDVSEDFGNRVVAAHNNATRPRKQLHSMDEVAELEHADPNAVLLWDIHGAIKVACTSDLMMSEAEWVSWPMTVLWESGDPR